MSESRPTCPRCHSHHIAKNGRIHNKKPKFQCQDCQRQFVENPTKDGRTPQEISIRTSAL